MPWDVSPDTVLSGGLSRHQPFGASCCFHIQGKGKGKVHTITDHEGLEVEQRYSCTLFLTSALDGVGGQLHAPAALPPGKKRYPLYRSLGGPQSRSGQVWKTAPHRRDSIPRPSIPQRVAIPTERSRPTPYLGQKVETRLFCDVGVRLNVYKSQDA